MARRAHKSCPLGARLTAQADTEHDGTGPSVLGAAAEFGLRTVPRQNGSAVQKGRSLRAPFRAHKRRFGFAGAPHRAPTFERDLCYGRGPTLPNLDVVIALSTMGNLPEGLPDRLPLLVGFGEAVSHA
jgi:hypothetical protein